VILARTEAEVTEQFDNNSVTCLYIFKCEVIALVTSRFLFNIGKTSSVLLAATFFVSGFSASQAEAAVTAADGTTGVQEAASGSKQLIARKPRKNVIKRKGRAVTKTTKTRTTVITPGSTTVIKETTTVTPAPTQAAPPAPNTESSAPVRTQLESEAAVTQQDLDRLRGLVDSYRTELEGVDSRINAAGSKDHKAPAFSTTTKLVGEVIVGINGYTGVGTTGQSTNGATVTDRIRLNFDTSFTGKDRLRTRLQARTTSPFNSTATGGTNMTRLGFDGDEGNSANVSLLQYTGKLGDTQFIAETVGSEFNENMNTFNPLLASAGTGSISRFGRYNPIYRLSGDGAALTLNQKFGDSIDVSVGYAIPTSNTAVTSATSGLSSTSPSVGVPGNNSGLFGANNAVIAQLAFRPIDGLTLGGTYAHSSHFDGNNIEGGTGSSANTNANGSSNGANRPFGSNAATADHVSFAASYNLGGPVVSGWYGTTNSTQNSNTANTATSNNYAVSLAFPDFGNKGNTLGLIYGQQPKLTATTVTGKVVDSDTSLHLEALYKIQMSDSLSVTPGILLITNPNNNSANATEYVGTIRTTFKF
jgi:predicted phage tail protein